MGQGAREAQSSFWAVVHLPAIQPLHRVVKTLGAAALPEVVAHQALHALGVEDAAHFAGRQHHACRAGNARALVQRQCLGEVLVNLLERWWRTAKFI